MITILENTAVSAIRTLNTVEYEAYSKCTTAANSQFLIIKTENWKQQLVLIINTLCLFCLIHTRNKCACMQIFLLLD